MDFLTWNIQEVVISPFCGFVIRVRGTAVLFEGPRYTPLFLRRTMYKSGRETGSWKRPGDLLRRLLNGMRTWCVTLLSLLFLSTSPCMPPSLPFIAATCILYFPRGPTTIYLNIQLNVEMEKSRARPCFAFLRSMSSYLTKSFATRNVAHLRVKKTVSRHGILKFLQYVIPITGCFIESTGVWEAIYYFMTRSSFYFFFSPRVRIFFLLITRIYTKK